MSELSDKLIGSTKDDGGCKIWRGACTNGHPSTRLNGKCQLVRRVVWSELNGPIESGKIIRCTCQTPGCINPEHLEKTTYKKLGKEMGAIGLMSGPVRSAKIAATKRASKQSKITEADARRIRYGNETLAVLAAELGINQAHVSKIRIGKAWREFSNPFQGLGAR